MHAKSNFVFYIVEAVGGRRRLERMDAGGWPAAAAGAAFY